MADAVSFPLASLYTRDTRAGPVQRDEECALHRRSTGLTQIPATEVKKSKKKVDFGDLDDAPEAAKAAEPAPAPKAAAPEPAAPATVDPVVPLQPSADLTLPDSEELDFSNLVRASFGFGAYRRTERTEKEEVQGKGRTVPRGHRGAGHRQVCTLRVCHRCFPCNRRQQAGRPMPRWRWTTSPTSRRRRRARRPPSTSMRAFARWGASVLSNFP
jgi:hypothetical protein